MRLLRCCGSTDWGEWWRTGLGDGGDSVARVMQGWPHSCQTPLPPLGLTPWPFNLSWKNQRIHLLMKKEKKMQFFTNGHDAPYHPVEWIILWPRQKNLSAARCNFYISFLFKEMLWIELRGCTYKKHLPWLLKPPNMSWISFLTAQSTYSYPQYWERISSIRCHLQ